MPYLSLRSSVTLACFILFSSTQILVLPVLGKSLPSSRLTLNPGSPKLFIQNIQVQETNMHARAKRSVSSENEQPDDNKKADLIMPEDKIIPYQPEEAGNFMESVGDFVNRYLPIVLLLVVVLLAIVCYLVYMKVVKNKKEVPQTAY